MNTVRRKLLYLIVSCSLFDRKNSPFVIGICIGIALSLIQTPFVQNECKKLLPYQAEQHILSQRELQQSIIDSQSGTNDDYDPFIKLDKNNDISVKESDEKKTKMVRPRYYSTELGMRNKVLVSIISSNESISTFGISINKTLNHFVDKLIFFVDGTGNKKFGLNIPIVGFKESKPLIKLFRIISYINENYLADFDYFFFATDHTYINGKRLMRMLEQISVNNNIHMGFPVRDSDSFYCSLDNGIILSHSVLETVVQELSMCTKNTFSNLDTENLGRCILHAANIPCQTTFKNQCFGSYSLDDTVDAQTYLEKLSDDPTVKKAITVANVQSASDIYRLHVFYLKEFVMETKDEIIEIRKNIERTVKLAPVNISLPWPIGSPPPHIPTSRHDIITWETFNATHLFMPNDFTNVQRLSGTDLLDIMNVVNSSVAHLKTRYPKHSFQHIRYGHRRYDPTRGMDYLISLDFMGEDQQIVNKKIEAFRGLTTPEIIPMPYVTENTKLTILLFLEKKDIADATAFFNRLISKVKITQLSLMICILYDEGDYFTGADDPFLSVKDWTKDYSKKHYNSQSRASYIQLTMPHRRSSPIALLDLALEEFSKDSLIYVTDKTAHFDTSFINRVRMNTIRNRQMFSPIPFIMYHPKAVTSAASYAKMQVTANNGHFDTFYYNQASFYVEDYVTARSKMPSIPIFKSEKDLERDNEDARSINVFDIFDADMDIQILRGVDPNLILSYSTVECPEINGYKTEKQLECETRQALSLGTKQMLSKLVFEHKEKTEKSENSPNLVV